MRKNQKTIVSPKNFFKDMLKQAFKNCEIKAHKMVTSYLCELLENYIETNSFFDLMDEKGKKKRETLAEIYLKSYSNNISLLQRKKLLKKLGDTSLYVTGFFLDSLKRKPVDVRYYIDMGSASYKQLADYTTEDSYSLIFRDFAKRFPEFVEVLNYISQKLFLEVDKKENLIHLYNLLLNKDSRFIRKQLIKKGFILENFSKKKAQ